MITQYSQILHVSTISDGTSISWNVLLLIDNIIFRYIGLPFSNTDIFDIRHNQITKSDVVELIRTKIKDLQGEELSPEQALEEHPIIKDKIIHLLRDKKLDELL